METSVALPVFFVFIFAVIEFGHVFLAIHTLNAAARRAARLGVSDGSTTMAVTSLAEDIVASGLDVSKCTILVKDGSVFDTANVDAESIDFDSLPDIDLSAAERRQLFVVRVSVNYQDIAILGPKWVTDLQIFGQAVMRKE